MHVPMFIILMLMVSTALGEVGVEYLKLMDAFIPP
jgi:hypothetical protein